MSKKATVERFVRLSVGQFGLLMAIARGGTPTLSVPARQADHTRRRYPVTGLRTDMAAIGTDFSRAVACYRREASNS
jgi:hypothetical protein